MRQSTALALAGTAALGALVAGSRHNPGPGHPGTAVWYARLEKPSFTPPGPVFGLAWPLLDLLLWFSGYRLLRAPESPARTTSLLTWGLTLLGIPAFSWAFFGRRRADGGLAASGAMLASAAALAATASRVDRAAAVAPLPLIAWLVFATGLQEEVWRRNR